MLGAMMRKKAPKKNPALRVEDVINGNRNALKTSEAGMLIGGLVH